MRAQLTIADALAASDAAHGRMRQGRDAEWIEDATLALRSYLETHREMHVDDWWAWALDRDVGTPHESRSLGAVVRAASRAGWMQKSGRSRPSKRSNGSDKPIWMSRIYSGGS